MDVKKAVKKKKCKCLRCGWKWDPRVENPAECPSCKSRDWNKKPKKAKVA